MSSTAKVGTAGLLLTLAALAWRNWHTPSDEPHVEVKTAPPQAAALCPWREPEADLQRFFPGATHCQLETRILSGLRAEVAQRLGREPTGDENALHLYRALQGATLVGSVVTRRVKGEHGAIELVLGVDRERRVCGARLQRLREPDAVARVLESTDWLGAFAGKTVESAWEMGVDLPQVPASARVSAEAVTEGARSVMALLAVAESAGQSGQFAHHH